MIWQGTGLTVIFLTIIILAASHLRDWLILYFPVLMVIAIIAGRKSKGELDDIGSAEESRRTHERLK